MRRLVILLAVACGGPPGPVTPIARPDPPAVPSGPRIYRQLAAGMALGHVRRTTFTLSIDGDTATLIETDEQDPRSLTIGQADRDAHWTPRATKTYRGPKRPEGDHFELDLNAPDVMALHLRCAARTLEVAAAGAQRVATPNLPADQACGDRGAWDPPATVRIDAWVCGAALQPAADEDDDDRLVFASAPGIEFAFENDDCLKGGGLRAAR